MSQTQQPSADSAPINFALQSEFDICGQTFSARIGKSGSGVVLSAVWKNEQRNAWSLFDFMEYFSISLPDFFKWQIVLDECRFSYRITDGAANFALLAQNYGSVDLHTAVVDGRREYGIAFRLEDKAFRLDALPVIGNLLSDGDRLDVNGFGADYTPGISAEIWLHAYLRVCGLALDLPLRYDTPLHDDSQAASRAGSVPDSAETAGAPSEVKWFDVNKSISVLTVKRIGFSIADSKAKLYLDVRFALSVLEMEVYEMFVSLTLDGKWKLGFGISGLMITFNKPPVSIGGGLYKAPDQTLYNGKLILRFSKFALTALGSYGEMQGGTPTFFMYLALDYALGGPPCFFVTGLALGFGVNRAIRLPELTEVDRFPLVADAMSGSGSNKSPEDALNQLSDWIYSSEGSCFACVGIKFQSYGIVNGFALAAVEFGKKLRISLLGVATITMPPNMQPGKSPIAFAKLNLRAVIDPEEGVFEMIGTLSGESYILDRNCRLTGGFAFCMWTKGQYAGDFVITLGGCHHPLFKNKHYPVLDRVGVNWKIGGGLSFVADGYVAITPNCLMAGARMELAYVDGSFKAWVRASMEFFIQWKPFFYDILISVSIGVSFVFIKRITMELGADIHLWGPEFSGMLTIDLYLFDVTIKFGGHTAKPPPLTWGEFYQDFLAEADVKNKATRASQGDALNSIYISDGLIIEIKEERLFVINPYRLAIMTHSKMPCTRMMAGETEIARHDGIGVVPMNKTGSDLLQSVQTIRVSRVVDNQLIKSEDAFQFSVDRQPLSPALWGKQRPGPNDAMIANVPVGAKIIPIDVSWGICLPSTGTGYHMQDLLLNELVRPKRQVCWCSEEPSQGIDYRAVNALEAIRLTLPQNVRRADVFTELHEQFCTMAAPKIGEIGIEPEAYFNKEPELRTTGAQALRR